ncbi:hypothetical protein D3C72_2274350 [compost metagenome]
MSITGRKLQFEIMRAANQDWMHMLTHIWPSVPKRIAKIPWPVSVNKTAKLIFVTFMIMLIRAERS